MLRTTWNVQDCKWLGSLFARFASRFMKLTPDTIGAIAPVPPKTEIIVFDDDLPGFGVRARLSGWKVFIVQYSIGNWQRRISLGRVDELDISQARQMAKEILTAVRMGQYPAGKRS
jgi:hypothetical protein